MNSLQRLNCCCTSNLILEGVATLMELIPTFSWQPWSLRSGAGLPAGEFLQALIATHVAASMLGW
jgi:hypothetical protein